MEGTGLGLAISSEFVQHMQGKLLLKSTRKDGSTFCAIWATRKPQRLLKSLKQALRVKCWKALAFSWLKMNSSISGLYRPTLKNRGGTVTVCANGQELLDAMDEGPADIMLMNIRMPVLNDIETTKIIRKKKELSLLPIPIPIPIPVPIPIVPLTA